MIVRWGLPVSWCRIHLEGLYIFSFFKKNSHSAWTREHFRSQLISFEVHINDFVSEPIQLFPQTELNYRGLPEQMIIDGVKAQIILFLPLPLSYNLRFLIFRPALASKRRRRIIPTNKGIAQVSWRTHKLSPERRIEPEATLNKLARSTSGSKAQIW